MVRGMLSVLCCGAVLLCKLAHSQTTHNASQPASIQTTRTSSQSGFHQTTHTANQQTTYSPANHPVFNQITHNTTNQPAFNQTQSSPSGNSQGAFNQSERTTSPNGQLGLNQSHHNQDGDNQEDHTQAGHDQTDHSQTDHTTSQVQTPAPEQSVDWLADCDALSPHANLSSQRLSQLPAALFNATCVSTITVLVLDHNFLTDLDPDLLIMLISLKALVASYNRLTELPSEGVLRGLSFLLYLDLSHNCLHSLPPASLPPHLYYLDLSFNCLTLIVDGAFHGLPVLQHFDLSHNQIHDIQPGAFEARMDSVVSANVSYNQLTMFDGWPYIFSEYVVADLRHNRISGFINRMNVTVFRESYGEVDLRYNNLTHWRRTDLSMYLNGKPVTPMIVGFYFTINIQHNPILCDCHLHWMVDLLSGHLLSQSPEMYNFFTCAAPPSLRGRGLGFLVKHGQLLVCQVLQGCPRGCRCLDTPHHRHVMVTCDPHLHTYTALPAELPAQGLVSLNLSHHALRRLEAGGCEVSRLKAVDVSHNRVSQVSASFLAMATRLEELDLRHNLLTSLPFALQRLSVDRLHVAGNPLVCSCQLVRFAHWAQTLAHNMSQEIVVTAPNRTDAPYDVPKWVQNNTDLLGLLSGADSGDGSADEQYYDSGDTTPTPSTTTIITSMLTPDLLSANCSLPGGGQASLADTSRWGLDCDSQHINVHALVWSGITAVLLLVGIALCWRWRYSLRVLLNYARSWLPGCPPKHTAAADEDGMNTAHGMTSLPKKNHVYISLDEKDDVSVTWVNQWLLPFLQRMGRKSLQVYLPLKHELPGVCTLESRAEVISDSHKFLLILTQGYVYSGLCRQELDYACHHHQTLCHKNIVIVLKEDLLPRSAPQQQALLPVHVTANNDDNTSDDNDSDVDMHRLIRPVHEGNGAEMDDIHTVVVEIENDREGIMGSRGGIPLQRNVDVLRTKSMPVGTHHGSPQRSPASLGPHRTDEGEVNCPAARSHTQIHHLCTPSTPSSPKRRRDQRKGDGVRQRVLEGLSQFWEEGAVVAVEPLRSFLLQGRYLTTSDQLFKQKLLFELRRT